MIGAADHLAELWDRISLYEQHFRFPELGNDLFCIDLPGDGVDVLGWITPRDKSCENGEIDGAVEILVTH